MSSLYKKRRLLRNAMSESTAHDAEYTPEPLHRPRPRFSPENDSMLGDCNNILRMFDDGGKSLIAGEDKKSASSSASA